MSKEDGAGRSLGLVQFAILAFIRLNPKDACGTVIATKIGEKLDRDISDAQVYMTLTRMNKMGLISAFINNNDDTSTRLRKYYRLTEKGDKVLDDAMGPISEICKEMAALKD